MVCQCGRRGNCPSRILEIWWIIQNSKNQVQDWKRIEEILKRDVGVNVETEDDDDGAFHFFSN